VTGEPVLIVGSYPPIPVAGARVTVAEVRRAWDAGQEVRVVAPRLSAAHVAIPVTGLLAARRLDYARQLYGARRIVLVVEPAYPLGTWGTAWSLGRALRRFDHIRVVRTADLPESTTGWHRLAALAHEVDVADPGPTAAGVTPLGSPEVTMGVRVRARLAPLRGVLRRAPAP
jgi:hypothetical protein